MTMGCTENGEIELFLSGNVKEADMEKTFIPVTKYLVQFLNPGWGWEPFEKSVEDKEAAKKIQRKARNETGCRTRIVAFKTNKYVED